MNNNSTDEELERLYNLGLELEKKGDLDGAEKAYLEALDLDREDYGGISIRLASMGRGKVPITAPRAYVTTLFDQHAEMFDYILVDQLGYDVPLKLADLLDDYDKEHVFKSMLDLGCGTGLSADALHDRAVNKTGVDLAEKMIEIAFEKGDYDHLFVGDCVEFVKNAKQQWELIVATDVLPYMGDIAVFFANIAKCLPKAGIFAFSTETLPKKEFDEKGYKVGKHQRFAHEQEYIKQELLKNGLEIMTLQDIVVRAEQGEDVRGHLILAKKI